MSKRQKVLYLREKIMNDIQDVNVLLDLITSYRVDTFAEAMTLAHVALEKSKRIDKYNEKIGRILRG